MTVEANPLQARGADVAMLSSALRRGGSALESVPEQIKQTLREGTWRHFVTRLGKEVRHERFAEFVATPPLAGLGANAGVVRKLIVDDAEALSLFDQAMELHQGERTDLSNNIREVTPPQGTSKDQALRKLRKDAPELHADVLAGRMSAHGAMVKAGFRPHTATVRTDSPEQVAAALRRALSPDDLARVIALLVGGGN